MAKDLGLWVWTLQEATLERSLLCTWTTHLTSGCSSSRNSKWWWFSRSLPLTLSFQEIILHAWMVSVNTPSIRPVLFSVYYCTCGCAEHMVFSELWTITLCFKCCTDHTPLPYALSKGWIKRKHCVHWTNYKNYIISCNCNSVVFTY